TSNVRVSAVCPNAETHARTTLVAIQSACRMADQALPTSFLHSEEGCENTNRREAGEIAGQPIPYGVEMLPKITLLDAPDDGALKPISKRIAEFNETGSG